MTPLEMKKLKVELIQVQAARASLELRIEEALDTIKRLEDSIKAQVAHESDLSEKISQAQLA